MKNASYIQYLVLKTEGLKLYFEFCSKLENQRNRPVASLREAIDQLIENTNEEKFSKNRIQNFIFEDEPAQSPVLEYIQNQSPETIDINFLKYFYLKFTCQSSIGSKWYFINNFYLSDKVANHFSSYYDEIGLCYMGKGRFKDAKGYIYISDFGSFGKKLNLPYEFQFFPNNLCQQILDDKDKFFKISFKEIDEEIYNKFLELLSKQLSGESLILIEHRELDY